MRVTILVFLLAIFSHALAGECKNILIVTATGYLGSAISSTLIKEGNNLVITGRNPAKVNALKSQLASYLNGKQWIETAIVDFTDQSTFHKLVQQLETKKIDGLVIVPPKATFGKNGIPTHREWLENLELVFVAPLELVRLAVPLLNDGASIVVICGNTSKSYLREYPNNNVLRLAWIGEIKNLSFLLGERKIRVNAVSPGVIMTPYHSNRLQQNAAKQNLDITSYLKTSTEHIPLRQYGNPQDVANLVSFMLSDKSRHISGANIVLDGGETTSY